MKIWIKGGLVGFFIAEIFAIISSLEFFANLNSFLRNFMDIFLFNLIVYGIFGFLLGWMILVSIEKIKRKKVYIVPFCLMVIYFTTSYLLGIFVSHQILVILAPFILFCYPFCNFFALTESIVFMSLIVGIFCFWILEYLEYDKRKKRRMFKKEDLLK